MRVRVGLAIVAASFLSAAPVASAQPPLLRLELHLAADAHTVPRPLLLTLGGPVYCMQLETLARNLGASLACADYGADRYVGVGTRDGRTEDWGDPAYLAEAAQVPARLRVQGVRISKLVVVGVSYSGFADAELVATHPELRPDALVVVDSYLDLPARYRALPPTHPTRLEIERVLGGTFDQVPQAYADRSPSHHLDGLARAIRGGTKLVVVWSVAASEQREFHGATCSAQANAVWLGQLASLLGRSVTGYVTQLPHAHALWDRGRGLLALAGIASTGKPLLARAITFTPGESRLPPGSYCS